MTYKLKEYELVHENTIFGNDYDKLMQSELSNYKTKKPLDLLKVGEQTLVEEDDFDEYMSDEAYMVSTFYIRRVR